jgi:hypothetical protein
LIALHFSNTLGTCSKKAPTQSCLKAMVNGMAHKGQWCEELYLVMCYSIDLLFDLLLICFFGRTQGTSGICNLASRDAKLRHHCKCGWTTNNSNGKPIIYWIERSTHTLSTRDSPLVHIISRLFKYATRINQSIKTNANQATSLQVLSLSLSRLSSLLLIGLLTFYARGSSLPKVGPIANFVV